MKAIQDLFYRLLGFLLVIALTGMCLMVFSNVVLRYGFNQSLVISEEMSRFFFVWLTFVGAVLTFRENAHIGIETLVQRLSRKGRLFCMFLSNIVVMACGAVFAIGAWDQLEINATMYAPVTGMSLAWVYGIGMFTGTGVFLIALGRALDVLRGQVSEEDLARFAGEYQSEEVLDAIREIRK